MPSPTQCTRHVLRHYLHLPLTDSEGRAGAGLLADGDAVPGDGGVGLGEEALLHALPRALPVAQHLGNVLFIVATENICTDRGAAGLLVGLHAAEALCLDLAPAQRVAQHQQVHPHVAVRRPAVPLKQV